MNIPTLRLGPSRSLECQTDDESWILVTVRPCFPWHQPRGYLALFDEENKEQGFVHDIADLSSESRHALETVLDVVDFTLQIDRVRAIDKELEIRNWVVDVGGRKRSFQTELDEWPRRLEDGRILIRDVGGDLYCIPDLEALDPPSRRLLWALVD